MLLRHSGLYAAARGLPALVNLLAIVVFSRMLSPEGYGHYVLVLAGVGLASALLFQWLRISLLRFLPAHGARPGRLLAPILSAYILLAGASGVGGLAILFWVPDAVSRGFVLAGVLLVCARGWFDLNQELARIRLAPVRFGLLSGTKAVVALIGGVGLILAGLDAFGALLGLLLGLVLTPMLFSLREWKGVRLVRFRMRHHGYLLVYGLPLVLNFVLVWVVASSDRVLLAWLLDVEAAGLYGVGYDLAAQSLTVVLMTLNLAAYPLAVRALEQHGPGAARAQLRRNGALLLALGVPAAFGLGLLAPEVAGVLVGSEFRPAASALIPWIAAGVLLSGIRSYHFDLAFQLGRRTLGQVWVSLFGGATNLGLNLLWIPQFGLMGAAYATVASFAVALASSVLLGRSAFRVPWEWGSLARVAGATGAMALVLLMAPRGEGLVGLAAALTLGVSVYGVAAVALNVGGVRHPLAGWIRARGAM